MIRIRSESLPLTEPLSTARGTIERRDCLLIRVGDPAGTGEAAPLEGWTEPFAEAEAVLQGVAESAATPGSLLTSITDRPAARHGLSLALLDHESRDVGVPLYRHLGGGSTVETVPVNATIGDGDPSATVANAEAAVADGYPCLKVKVGNRPVAADIERVRAVRERLPDVDLRLDANGAWSREEAARAIDGVAPLDIDYLEQPLDPRDIEGHGALGGRVAIALDESLRFVEADGIGSLDVDAIVCKPMVLGGVDRTREVVEAARAAGIRPVISNTVDAAVARTAAVHLAASLAPVPPCGLATAHRLADDVAPDPAPVADGAIAVPQAPGHGVEVAW